MDKSKIEKDIFNLYKDNKFEFERQFLNEANNCIVINSNNKDSVLMESIYTLADSYDLLEENLHEFDGKILTIFSGNNKINFSKIYIKNNRVLLESNDETLCMYLQAMLENKNIKYMLNFHKK